MAEQEGVIKYQLAFTPSPVLDPTLLTGLIAWQRIAHSLGLMGRDPSRYEGLAYGNISERHDTGFIVSASQCADRVLPGPEDYCLVTGWDCAANRLTAHGPRPPSSESLSHAALYDADPRIGAVLHGHSAEIWERAVDLQLPITDPSVEYGTPAMADALAGSYHGHALPGSGVIAMGGHRDGVIACGANLDQAGGALVTLLARARQLCG